MDAVPAVGQHTEAILRELGRDHGAVATLKAAGAIRVRRIRFRRPRCP